MKRSIYLSLCVAATLHSAQITLETLQVSSTTLDDVAQNTKTSADVAQALSDSIPSVDMNRRSGIANDVFIRGQKRDNISVEVDETKIYGACPNRMDPPVSHILANQIDTIEVVEGPYDVTTYGNLSGGLKIETKKPSKDFQAQINLGFGAWNYKKFGASASGGNDLVRVIFAASTESSDQYKDGDGHTIAEQIDNYVLTHPTAQGAKYQPAYHDMQAYTKKSAMAKMFVSTAKNQELRLSVTANRSDNVLYGNSKMDAIYDDSNIYSIAYNIDNINSLYKNINIKYYHSDVDHPMGTDYRMASTTNPVMTNWLTTQVDGLKLKNSLKLGSYTLLIGLDGSERKWDGHYEKNHATTGLKSIDNAITKNRALFAKLSKNFGAFNISVGARYDDTSVANDTYQNNDYNSLGANILATYNFDPTSHIFFGLGQAYRVPDGRELYFVDKTGALIGTPNLKDTRNREVDFGYETDHESFSFKFKTFYSQLSNYIYYHQGKATNTFENIDAIIYGGEVSGSYYLSDDLSLDASASYKRGKKDHALAGQNNTNLADIAPLRGSIALNYEYANNSLATLESVMSDRWDNIDSDNGEQVLAGWAIVNAKVKHALNKKIDLTLGVNNMFNITYAQSNTYADLTLVTGGGDVMLMNEPGRYIYTNLDLKF